MISLLVTMLTSARAETAGDVVARVQAANRVESAIESVRMTIVSKSGSERVRDFEIRSRRTGEISKTYMKFTSPSDVAGMQFLLIDNPAGTDERMTYVPSLKKVTLISSANAGNFAGSDFTYEDLAIRDAISGTHTLVEDTPERWVIDTAMHDSSYAKVRTTIGKSDLVIQKVEFFDSSGPIKVLEVKKTEKDGTVTLPVETEMSDLRRGTRTRLTIVSHQLNVAPSQLPEETFTRAYLERGG